MPKKFTKDNIHANVKTWEDYQEDRLKKNHDLPILLPVYVGMNEEAEIIRNRIKANLLGDPSDSCSIIAKAIENSPKHLHEFLKKVHKDYDEFFNQDKNQSAFPASPLDFDIKMPVLFMFYLSNDNWSFTGVRQFSTDNDVLGNPTVKQINSFDSMSGILVENNNKAGKRIKYNLHVTISQYVKSRERQEAELMTTDIIIDPGMDTDDDRVGD